MHARPSTLALLPCCAALLLVAGCDIEFPDQQVRLQHDVEADSLELILSYEGVCTPSSSAEDLRDGAQVADRILAGRRELMLLDWPFLWDLDELAEDEDQPAAIHALIQRVELVDVGAYMDQKGRLACFQHFRLSSIEDTLSTANELITAGVQLAMLTGELADEIPWMDRGEQALWGKFVAAREPWIELDSHQLVARIPMSARGAARALELTTQEALKDEERGESNPVQMLLANIDQIELAQGVARLQLGALAGGQSVLRLRRGDVEYSPAFHDHLRQRGLDLADAPSAEEVRNLLLRDPEGSSPR